jgi:hypothetical protein
LDVHDSGRSESGQFPESSLEDPLDVEYGADGQEKKRGPSLERFIAQQEHQQTTSKEDAQTADASSPEERLRNTQTDNDFSNPGGVNLRSEPSFSDSTGQTQLNRREGQLRSTLQDPTQNSMFFLRPKGGGGHLWAAAHRRSAVQYDYLLAKSAHG